MKLGMFFLTGRFFTWSLAFILTLTTFTPGWADDFGGGEEEEILENPLTAEMSFKHPEISAGAQTEVIIDMKLAEGYHAYLDKFKLEWDGNVDHGLKIGKPDIGPVSEFKDTFSGEMKKGIENAGTLRAVMEIPASMKAGELDARLKLTYQACTAKHCLFPKKIPLNAKLIVNNASVALAEADNTGGPTVEAGGGGFFGSIGKAFRGELSFSQAVAEGMLFSFIFIFLAGVLTSFTPCVYPMIPITLAVIGAKTKDQTKAKSLSLSIVYVLGIALTFSSLGVVAALTGSLFGSALSNPVVVGVLAAIFVILGLSMYGVFELQAPAGLRNKLGSQKNTGYFGALFAGLVSGVVAGPCVGPVLLGVLTHVGEKQDPYYGFFLLFTYSIGMGLLFIAIGTSSNLLNKLPRAGGWMDGVKFFFGTIMIAMALYYIKPLASDRLFYSLLAVALILISSSYGAFVPNEGLTNTGRLKKGVMLTSFIVGVIFMLQAVFGANLLAGVAGQPGQMAKADKLPWQPYSDEAIEQAKQSGKPIIVDFFAEWCVACKELEMLTFTAPEVKSLAKDFALLKFDATEDSQELARLKKKYNIRGLPTVLFIDAEGNVNTDLTLTGFEEGEAFSKRMKKTL